MKKLFNALRKKTFKLHLTKPGLNGEEIKVCGIFLGRWKYIYAPHKYNLFVSPDVFRNMSVVCDGEALEVSTERLSENRYEVKRKLRGFEPAIIEDTIEVSIEDFSSTKSFIIWIEDLSTDELQAYRQIYFERWNLDTGHKKDGIYYELLDEEYQRRQRSKT